MVSRISKYFLQLSFVCVTTMLFFACESDKSEDGSSKTFQQKARGETGEVILVMDSAQWGTGLGEEIRDIFRADVTGLPQAEPMFDIKRVDPSLLNNVLKATKNMIVVTTLNNNSREGKTLKRFFTENSLKQIQENPDLFSFNKSDVYANGQEVLYLFGRNEEELLKNLRANKESLQNYFNEVERKRLLADLKKSPERGIMTYLMDTMNIDMIIPFGFDVAEKEDDFVWLRQLGNKEENNIWMVKMPYTNQSVFNLDSIVSFRNALAKEYITDKDIDSLFLTTQQELPIEKTVTTLNGNYAVQLKGLWKYSDNSRGGAFIGYLTANEDTGELFYVEAYLDNPGESKREPMRYLKTILKTIDFPDTQLEN